MRGEAEVFYAAVGWRRTVVPAANALYCLSLWKHLRSLLTWKVSTAVLSITAKAKKKEKEKKEKEEEKMEVVGGIANIFPYFFIFLFLDQYFFYLMFTFCLFSLTEGSSKGQQ